MAKCFEIMRVLNEIAPLELKEEWDNCGLLVGDKNKEIEGILFSLDLNSKVIEDALTCGCNLIVTHHPIMLKPLSRVVTDDIYGNMVIKLIKNDINLYSMHTNLDKADGGINDKMCELIGLCDVGVLDEKTGLGRIGVLNEEMKLSDFAEEIYEIFGCNALKYVGDPEMTIKTVAVLSGSGSDFCGTAYEQGADVLVTSEPKQHFAQFCTEKGIALIDSGHFETEDIIIGDLKERLLSEFPDINMYKSTMKSYYNVLGDI